VARIESMVEDAAALWPSFEDVVDHVGKRLEAAVVDGLVALKTIAAYRCGLGLPSPDRAAAQRGYDHWRRSQSHRLVNADVISFFIAEALDVTREACLPIQVHTGLVGTDTNLRDADPALLRTWLNETVPDRVSVVLLHCHPFLRGASWLAALYPNVYIDLSMAMQWVAHRGADLILESVDVAPISKLLFATDGFRVPELFFLVRSGGGTHSQKP
jgi:hypothetical protein